MDDPLIAHHRAGGAARARFDLMIAGAKRGHLSYSLPDAVTMVVEYVEVDPSLRGRGMGERLVAAAVEWARANGRRIVPLCSYARAVIARTAEYQDVLR
jgi:predicted GNAT family acetyltransferase